MPEVTTPKRQTKEQERAAKAWDLITQEVKGKNFADKYSSYVKSASTLIQTNGLINTLAFYNSKGENAHIKLLSHLQIMVTADTGITMTNLLEKLRECNVNEYRNFTKSALANLIWLKRFAEAELEG